MCEQEEFEATGLIGEAAAGDRWTLRTPDVRHQLQICLVSVETMWTLGLPTEAQRCVASIERAVGLLAKGLTGTAPSQIADSRRLFR